MRLSYLLCGEYGRSLLAASTYQPRTHSLIHSLTPYIQRGCASSSNEHNSLYIQSTQLSHIHTSHVHTYIHTHTVHSTSPYITAHCTTAQHHTITETALYDCHPPPRSTTFTTPHTLNTAHEEPHPHSTYCPRFLPCPSHRPRTLSLRRRSLTPPSICPVPTFPVCLLDVVVCRSPAWIT